MLAVLAVLTMTIFSVKIRSFIYIDPIGQFLIDEQNFFGCEEKKETFVVMLHYIYAQRNTHKECFYTAKDKLLSLYKQIGKQIIFFGFSVSKTSGKVQD